MTAEPDARPSIAAEALDAHQRQEADARGAAAVAARDAAAAQRRRSLLVAAARKWALPILDAKFGARDWQLSDPDPDGDAVAFAVDDQPEPHTKKLVVHRSGKIEGEFAVTLGADYDVHREWVDVADIAHLGRLLARERKINDEWVRWAATR